MQGCACDADATVIHHARVFGVFSRRLTNRLCAFSARPQLVVRRTRPDQPQSGGVTCVPKPARGNQRCGACRNRLPQSDDRLRVSGEGCGLFIMQTVRDKNACRWAPFRVPSQIQNDGQCVALVWSVVAPPLQITRSHARCACATRGMRHGDDQEI